MARLDAAEIALGVTGSVAAYKSAQIASDLVKRDIGVTVVMTANAMRFITPLTFETITRKPVITDLVCDPANRTAQHIALSDRCSALVIAPATANIIGKIACGIADDILSTTAMSFPGPLVLAPAMNTMMWRNEIVQQNMETLKAMGSVFVGPEEGRLADGKTGIGRLAKVSRVVEMVEQVLESGPPRSDSKLPA
jgi:phosphopantothenoylcysteine decarboxylase/phosphopantothenate--cysteine ligase